MMDSSTSFKDRYSLEDDEDDRILLEMVFNELGFPNQVVFLPDVYSYVRLLEGRNYLPIIILSDINLPKLNGFELRKMVHTSTG